MEYKDSEMTNQEEGYNLHNEEKVENNFEELKIDESVADMSTKASLLSTDYLSEASEELSSMGYQVVKREKDNQHEFVKTKDNSGFTFTNQKAYDDLGDSLCNWIQAYMMDKHKLKKVRIPVQEETNEGAGRAPIFVSSDWQTNEKGALVLIQGTGDVRPGYWARSVCMNDTLELGSMIPDIEWAQNNNYSVLVMNPNYTKDEDGNFVDKKVRGMGRHASYAWEKFVENGVCPAKQLYVIAHSAGGACIHEIIVNNQDTMINKVKGIALTDACHGNFYSELSKDGKKWAKKSCKAYDASSKKLDTPLSNGYSKSPFPTVSAGHVKHVYTTGCARPSYLKSFCQP